MPELPSARENQQFCTISALEGGILTGQESLFIAESDVPGNLLTLPALCFLIQHSKADPTPKRLVFDLGINPDLSGYTPKVRERIEGPNALFRPDLTAPHCLGSLAHGGATTDDIDFVILSHCHWDHIGDTHPFTKSTFVVGHDTKTLFESGGYPTDPNSWYPADLLPAERARYLPPTSSDKDWAPIGPFPHALDFFGDGSLYVIDSPGHLAGHINLLIRTSADGGWIYLGGDSVHDRRLLTGEAHIRVGLPDWPEFCMHVNREEAEAHVARIRELEKTEGVRVVFAHDVEWYEENKGGAAFWPGKIEPI